MTHPYRTFSGEYQKFHVGDKVIAHTKPWSRDNIHGHGHHELWNNMPCIVTSVYEPRKYQVIGPGNYWYGRGHYFYEVKFFHCTYIAMLTEQELEFNWNS